MSANPKAKAILGAMVVIAAAAYLIFFYQYCEETVPPKTGDYPVLKKLPDGKHYFCATPFERFTGTYPIVIPDQKALSQQIDTSNWNTYRNEKYGFEVRYPSGWLVGDSGGYVSFRKSMHGPDILSISDSVDLAIIEMPSCILGVSYNSDCKIIAAVMERSDGNGHIITFQSMTYADEKEARAFFEKLISTFKFYANK